MIILKGLGTFIDFVLALYNTNDYIEPDGGRILTTQSSLDTNLPIGNFSAADIDSFTDVAGSQTSGILGSYLPTIFGLVVFRTQIAIF